MYICAGAESVTFDGLSLTDAPVFAVDGLSDLTFANNIVQGNSVGVNFNATGPTPSTFTHNRFVDNNLSGENAGSSIFVSSGTVSGLVIDGNLFQGNVGDGVSNAADISTPGAATLSTGIVIQDNTSIDGASFLVASNTSAPK